MDLFRGCIGVAEHAQESGPLYQVVTEQVCRPARCHGKSTGVTKYVEKAVR
jgi:hypothetical protein